MKRIITFLITLALIIIICTFPVSAGEKAVLNISVNDSFHNISDKPYGISIEDISYAFGGGLVSNLVNNDSFEYELDKTFGWSFENVSVSTDETDTPLNQKNPTYATITVSGKGSVTNLGFIDSADNEKKSADMGFKENTEYDFSCYINNKDFDGTVSVYLDSPKNRVNITELDISKSGNLWYKLSTTLTSVAQENGGLTIEFNGRGTICLDFVTLVPKDSHGYGTDEWKYTTLRADLYTAIERINPSFIRFSGENLNNWKDTIGPLAERVQSYNLWTDNEGAEHSGYINTMAMGYHEYFQLCSDLKAEPIPVVNVSTSLSPDTKEWNAYVQNILDLIEYANGDSITSYWGAIRASNGSTEPFNLKYIELGDENFIELSNEINKAYPEITVIHSTKSEIHIDKFDIFNAVELADFLTGVEKNGDVVDMASYAPTIVGTNALYDDKSIILFDSQEVVLTPSYYVQQLFANNYGTKYLESTFENGDTLYNGIYESVTVDEASQTLYVKLVNTSEKAQSVDVNLADFGSINRISAQSISSSFSSACNEIGKNTTYPVEYDLTAGESVTVDMDKYDVTVLRVAYGNNDGASLYTLPDFISTMTTKTTTFIPAEIKIAIPCAVSGVVIIFALAVIIKKKTTKKNGE
ncbi:MAG: hypothetical protein J1E36_02655 [Eubacterium sp.]|nr:hypothetical protein [Eubacterium sp.]